MKNRRMRGNKGNPNTGLQCAWSALFLVVNAQADAHAIVKPGRVIEQTNLELSYAEEVSTDRHT